MPSWRRRRYARTATRRYRRWYPGYILGGSADSSGPRRSAIACALVALGIIGALGALTTIGSLAAAQPPAGSGPIVLGLGEDTVDLATYARVYVATEGETLEAYPALRRAGRFAEPAASAGQRFHDGGELWIVLDLEDREPAPGPHQWVIWNRGAAQILDARIEARGRVTIQRSGYFVPPQERPLQAFGYAFPLELERGERAHVVLRGYLPPRESNRFEVLSGARFREHNITTSLLVFGVIGAMLALALYNLLVFVVVRDPAYGYYALYALSSMLLWAVIHSVITLFTRDGRSDLTLQGLLVLLTALSSLRFTQVFLDLGRTAPRLHRLFFVLSAAVAMTALPLLLLPQQQFKLVGLVVGVPVMSALVLTPIQALVRGQRRARLMIVGWAPLMTIPLLIALRGLGVIEADWISKDVFLAFHGFEILSMALAVGDRIRELDTERARAQRDAVAQLTLRLEQQQLLVDAVHATRTAEQETERERVRASTDELTGLRNRRAFDSERPRLAQEWRRDAGENDLLVCVLDVDGLKGLNDARGHAEGDRMLALFGRSLRAALRDSDRTYRLGGDELAVIARANDDAARTAIERRIRGAIDRVRQEFAEVDASLGSVFLSEVGGDLTEACRRADERMYAEKRARHAARRATAAH